MAKPLQYSAMWLGASIAVSLSLPIIALGGKLGGGLLLLICLLALAATALFLIGYGLAHAWKSRHNRFAAILSGVIPPVVVILGALMLPVLSELSWQVINGPRDVDIWPY